jgi:hypothetical protein
MADVTIGLECEISNQIYQVSKGRLKEFKQGKKICKSSSKSPVAPNYPLLEQHCDLTNIEHVTGPLHVGDLKIGQQKMFKDCLRALNLYYEVNMYPVKYKLKKHKDLYRYVDIIAKVNNLIDKNKQIKDQHKLHLKIDPMSISKHIYVKPLKKAPGIHANVGIMVGQLDKLIQLFKPHSTGFIKKKNLLLSRYNLALSSVNNIMDLLSVNHLVKKDKESRGAVLFLAWYMANRGAGLKDDMSRNNEETDVVTYRKNTWGVMPKTSLKTILSCINNKIKQQLLTTEIRKWKQHCTGINFNVSESTLSIANANSVKFKDNNNLVQKLYNCYDANLITESKLDVLDSRYNQWSYLELGIIKTLKLLSKDNFMGEQVEDLNEGSDSYSSFKLNNSNAIIVECRAEYAEDTPICKRISDYIKKGDPDTFRRIGQSLLTIRNINSDKKASRYHW